ncbi:hypothetical protein K458DRAFT_280879, partial [Lentithecium fluviatile CBS 122367]
ISMELSMTKGVLTIIPAPEGYDVDFDNPKRNGDVTCYCLTGLGGFLALLFLGQRLYVKAVLRKRLTIDDCESLVILLFFREKRLTKRDIRALLRKYIGVHAWEMPFSKFQENYFVRLIGIESSCPLQIFILVRRVHTHDYLRPTNCSHKTSTYTTMFISVGASTVIFFASIFACSPIAMGWDLTVSDGTCIDRPALYEATAAFGVVVDCLIIAIPIPMVMRLQMSRSKKIGLILMFVLGSITLVTLIVRLALLVTKIEQVDSTWVAGPINYWVLIGANLLIICASQLTIRQFLQTVALRLLSS